MLAFSGFSLLLFSALLFLLCFATVHRKYYISRRHIYCIYFIVFRLGRHSSLGNSPIGSIRDELVKSLANNKKKRDEIENARRKIDSLQAELESLTKENTQLENAIKNFEVSI